jgi:hypothetical protein
MKYAIPVNNKIVNYYEKLKKNRLLINPDGAPH